MIGKTIAHYEILELLGKGGMGEVYKARDNKLDRFVALKFLPPQQSMSREAKQRFVREAQAASALDHANICTIHEIAETDAGETYIVMAHYEGQTLDKKLESGALAPEQAADLARQLAAALERAHESGISHRDLKPGNIMVTDHGELKLLDFGLAKLSTATQLTQAGTTLGTIDYMSPEQADAKDSDHRSDLWSFGVVLYQMLTGSVPFQADSPAAKMRAIVEKEPAPLPAGTPEELAHIVERCLDKNPDARPSASQLLAELAPKQPTSDATIVVERPPRGRRNSWVAALALLLFAAAVWMLTRDEDSPGAPGAELDSNRIAVIPFEIRGGDDYEYLGEGLVDMLSAKLGSAATLSTANPRAVIALARRLEGDPSDPAVAAEIARGNGAGRFVSGSVLDLGGRIEITAYLGDSSDPAAETTQVQRGGAPMELLAIIDALVAELMSESLGLADGEFASLGVATSSSLPALREYLEGERVLRVGLYREAAAAYDRAIAADSTFALAYYRKSVAADWIDAPDIRITADRAFELGEKIPMPERDLVVALRARRHGHSEEAQQIYRAVLHQHPDHVEALVQLGEALFHEGPRVGRSIMESMEPFRRAALLEPNNLIAQIHLARLYALADSLGAVERIADQLVEFAPDSPRATEVEALAAYMSGDAERVAALEQQLEGKPWHYFWYSAHGVMRFLRDEQGAADIMRLQENDSHLLLLTRQFVDIVRGRQRSYREYADRPEQRSNPNWTIADAFILTSGTVPLDRKILEDLIERLKATEPAEILRTNWLPPYPDLTERFLAFERDYFVALALIQLDRLDEAKAIMARMEREARFEALGTVNTDALTGLRAEILFRDGEFENALELIRTVRSDLPHATTSRPMADAGRSRLLRAELEFQIGELETAKKFYLAFDESWSPWDTIQRPIAYERLGSIAEQQGEYDQAILWYGRLLELWKDCDPEFIDARERVRARRDALVNREIP